jgi:hypothetical protein
MIFLRLFHPLLPFATFSSAYLFFYIPEDSNLMRFSLLVLLLWVMCVQSTSIFFFSDFLLTSVGCIPSDIFPRCNFTQFICFWKTALHVLGGIFTHHQEHI